MYMYMIHNYYMTEVYTHNVCVLHVLWDIQDINVMQSNYKSTLYVLHTCTVHVSYILILINALVS